MKAKFEELQKIVSDIQTDVEKFTEHNNKSAGLRVRKAMQEVKVIAQDIRKYVLENKKNGTR